MALRRDDGQAPGLRSSLAPALAAVLTLVAGCYQSHETGTGSGPVADAGPRRDGAAPSCDEESLPPYAGPPCSEPVIACHRACPAEDEPCRDACLDDRCRECIYGTIFHCANERGCQPLWGAFACCVEAVPMCRHLRGFDRARCAMSCPMRFDPYARCIDGTGTECFLRAASNCNLR